MMYWKSMLLGGLLAASAGLSADEAVRLTNPDFEKGTTGWGGHGTQPKESAERAKILTVVPGEKPGNHALKLQDIQSKLLNRILVDFIPRFSMVRHHMVDVHSV